MKKEIIDSTSVMESITSEEQSAFTHACNTVKILKDNIRSYGSEIDTLSNKIDQENSKRKYTEPNYVSPLCKTVENLKRQVVIYTQQIEQIMSRLPHDDPVKKYRNCLARKNTCLQEIPKLQTEVVRLTHNLESAKEFYDERQDLMDKLRDKYLEFAKNNDISFNSEIPYDLFYECNMFHHENLLETRDFVIHGSCNYDTEIYHGCIDHDEDEDLCQWEIGERRCTCGNRKIFETDTSIVEDIKTFTIDSDMIVGHARTS
jgi:hypothetical protein